MFPFFIGYPSKNVFTNHHLWCAPKLLQRFKCESKNENNGKKSWGTLPTLQHFGGKKGMLEFWNKD
jgi:hypothetical protein